MPSLIEPPPFDTDSSDQEMSITVPGEHGREQSSELMIIVDENRFRTNPAMWTKEFRPRTVAFAARHNQQLRRQ
jgi:hypothetical protein